MMRRGRSRLPRLVLASLFVMPLVGACSPAPTPPPATPLRVSLGPIEVIGVGELGRGATSSDDLVIRLTELANDSIRPGAGSLDLVMTDSAGTGDAVSFTGTPSIFAPGSLGVTAHLTRGNMLTIEIVDSDPLNIEPMTIEGLRLVASTSAALGKVNLSVSGCSGSLAGCTADSGLASPGTVIEAPPH